MGSCKGMRPLDSGDVLSMLTSQDAGLRVRVERFPMEPVRGARLELRPSPSHGFRPCRIYDSQPGERLARPRPPSFRSSETREPGSDFVHDSQPRFLPSCYHHAVKRFSRRPEGEDAVADAVILQRTTNRLRGGALIPRDVYRFRSHEEADEWMIREIANTHAHLSSKTSSRSAKR